MTLVRGDEWLTRPGPVDRGFLSQIHVLDRAGHPVPPGTTGTVFTRARPPAAVAVPHRTLGPRPARSNAGGWPPITRTVRPPP
ncbi:MAG: hypothetical protein M3Z75_23920 [Actinomycetota bacterium]|nr:hypothetical protein [Actinomycetota bacterium]